MPRVGWYCTQAPWQLRKIDKCLETDVHFSSSQPDPASYFVARQSQNLAESDVHTCKSRSIRVLAVKYKFSRCPRQDVGPPSPSLLLPGRAPFISETAGGGSCDPRCLGRVHYALWLANAAGTKTPAPVMPPSWHGLSTTRMGLWSSNSSSVMLSRKFWQSTR